MERVIIFLHLCATLAYVKKAMFRGIDVEGFAKNVMACLWYTFSLSSKLFVPSIMKIFHRRLKHEKDVSPNRRN